MKLRVMSGVLTGMVVALAVTACGGDSAPSADSAPPAAETSPGAPSPDVSSDTGGASAGVCDLASSTELATALGVDSVTTEAVPGPPDMCSVTDPEGNILATWSYNESGGQALYDSLVLPGQSEEVPGIGDAAAHVVNTGLLVAKGDSLVMIAISGESGLDEAAAQAAAEAIGASIAGQM